ncbi:hypothetical protein GRI42_13800 [Erythrobacter gaetbuli]|uniref:5-methylcytosine-specific restriction endonuclease system specificity protein McrC n=1 Tax=Qipengyuania gaetbuli TaxID=266952 RepID=A0A844Y1V6_9SPHN|nr:hypothetical protein [Qipengyuania gaetbuli]MXO52380.1 hypothetical protein [Qipengyuania gaetbuli]
MLLYAWGHFRPSELELVGRDESPNLPTLLARVLDANVHRLLRRGLDRGYLSQVEEGRSVRGRIQVSDIAKRQTVRLRGTAIYEYDELSPDVLHNQIIYETLLRLARSEGVEQKTRHEVGLTARRFRDVSRVHLTQGIFRRVVLSRNTSQYALLMHICELLFHELMPDPEGSQTQFKGIQDDKTRMEALFEEFLRAFYRAHLAGREVVAKEYTWAAGPQDAPGLALLPKMRTDITVRSPQETLTIEAKFNRKVLVPSQHGGEKLRSGHLYQLHAYLSHAAHYQAAAAHRGLLLYAQREQPIDSQLTIFGRPVRVATIDLGQEWQVIHARLLKLAEI